MSYESEEVSTNPLYTALISRVNNFEVRAAEKKWILLIPKISSLQPLQNTLEGSKRKENPGGFANIDVDYTFSTTFLHSHIIFKSPYLKQEYVTLNGDRVRLSNGELYVIADGRDEAHSEDYQVKILFDEIFYNDHGSYKVFCINSPLLSHYDPENVEKLSSVEKVPRFIQDGKEVFDVSRSIYDWMFVLNRDVKNGKALRYLESYADDIVTSYVLVLNSIGIRHFLDKIEDGVVEATKLLASSNPAAFSSALSDKTAEAILHRVLEAYLMTGVNSVVFGSLINFHRKSLTEGISLQANERMKRGGGATYADEKAKLLGANPLLAALKRQGSPLGKLEALRSFIVDTSHKANTQCNADYVLSLLVQYIPGSKNLEIMAHFNATLQYMTEFIVFQPEPELIFIRTQFQAAIQFVVSRHRKLANGRNTFSNSLKKPIVALPSKNMKTSIRNHRTSGTESNYRNELEDVSTEHHELAASSETARTTANLETSRQSVTKQESRKQKGELGGFLETLRECSADVVTSTYSFN